MYWPHSSPLLGGALVTEVELRRYLRHASCLLGSAPDADALPGSLAAERILILRRAEVWLSATLLGVQQLRHDAERRVGVADTIDDPLTARVAAATIASQREDP